MLWILQFVEKRIQQDQKGQTLEQFNSSYDLRTNAIVKQALTMSSSADIDISELWVVVQTTGGLLRPGEFCQAPKQNYLESSRSHSPNTEYIYAYCRRNLDESDYDDHIKESVSNE